MTRICIYLLACYLSGSILYAHMWGRLLCRKDITAGTRDGNPDTANAFMEGGFLCGILTLICDLGKGFAPVWLFLCEISAEISPSVWHCLPSRHDSDKAAFFIACLPCKWADGKAHGTLSP